MLEEIISERLGERYYKYTHSSGVTVLLYPMKGYSTVTAQFSVKFGSVDNCASINGGAPHSGRNGALPGAQAVRIPGEGSVRAVRGNRRLLQCRDLL